LFADTMPRVIGRNRRALGKSTASKEQKNAQDCRMRANSPRW
jgi:hypothetical protein